MPAALFQFGDFELDCARYELRLRGRPLRLEKIPMELLQLLVESEGRLVTREEIEERLWGREVFVDAEHGINTAVRKIRQVLEDDPEAPRFVLTVPRKGYRFIAEVRREKAAPPVPALATLEASPRAEAEDARSVPAAAGPPRRGNLPRRAIWSAVGVAALLLAWPTYRLAVSRSTRAAASPVIRSIAVLPLENLSGDPQQEYFADGMTDELITMLAKYQSLRVISRTSAMQFKKTKKSLPEIAKELSVDGIVEGSISRAHDKVRVTAQLVYGPTDTHLWAESYSRDLSDALLLQHDLAKDIAERVNAISSGAAAARSPGSAGNPKARDIYFHGRYEWFSSHYTKSRELFQDAIRLDPNYAAAYSGLADSYTAAVAEGEEAPGAVRPLAEAAAEKALELDDALPEAHHAMAAVDFFFRWDWAAAERECLRTLELNPSLAETHHIYAYVLGTQGRTEESLEQDKITLELDPFARPWAYGYGLIRARRYDEAIQELRQRAAARPESANTICWLLCYAYEQKGDQEAAIEAVRTAVKEKHELAGRMERAYQSGGMPAVHAELLAGMKKAAADGKYVSPAYLAEEAASAGLRSEALRYIQQAFDQRDAHLVYLEHNPAFDALHSEPRFVAIAKKMHLPEAEAN